MQLSRNKNKKLLLKFVCKVVGRGLRRERERERNSVLQTFRFQPCRHPVRSSKTPSGDATAAMVAPGLPIIRLGLPPTLHNLSRKKNNDFANSKTKSPADKHNQNKHHNKPTNKLRRNTGNTMKAQVLL